MGTSSNLAGCSVFNANQSPLIGTSTSTNVSANIGSLTAATTYYYNISATNSNGTSSTSIFSFTTEALPLEVTTQNGGLAQGTVGVAYSNTLVAAGGNQPYSWAVTSGSLPAGLQLNVSTGVISGTPTTAGNYTFTIKVTDNANINTLKEFTLAVVGSPTATTSSVTSISVTTATLNGLVNPRNLITAVSFCYGTNASFAGCTQVTPSQSPIAAGTSDSSMNANIINLTADTTYYVRVTASNNAGSTTGNSISFTTASPPIVTTGTASNLNTVPGPPITAGATLNAAVNPKSNATAVTFCYGTSPTLVGCTSVTASQSPLGSSTQSSAVSAVITGLSANTVYFFNTKGQNDFGITFGTTGTFTTPTGIVPPPTITQISPSTIGDISGASVTITGTGFSTTGAQAQVTIGGTSALVTSRASTTGIVVTAPPGIGGATEVVVTNIDGQSASTSLRLSFTSSAPTSVAGTVDNSRSIVTWTAPASVTPAISNYLVQYSANGGNSWTSVTRSTSTTASQEVSGLINGTSYIFRVATINSVGTGTFSSNSSAVIPETVPEQPTNLTGIAGNGQATLNWVAPTDNGGRSITTYRVDYSTDGGTNFVEYQHPISSATSLVVTGLSNGANYIFRVAATNSVGRGNYSSNSSTVTLVAPLSLAFGTRPIVILGETNKSVSATTSPSGIGTIVFASTTPLVCTVNSSTGALTILTTGTCSITANNSGTALYSAAPQQTQDIPVSSGSLAGLQLSDLTELTTATVIGSNSYILNANSSDTQLTLNIPSNALPSGTLVKIYLNNNLTTAPGIITSSNYLLNFVVGWMKTDDGSLPIATTPLVITAVNASIKKGMVGYGILNGVPTPLGTATSDGSITMYMTEDPLLVVAPTKPGSPTSVQASSGLNQSSLVSWTIPSNDGGEPITSYEVTASPGGGTCTANGATATSCTVSNLQNGTSYTFTVKARNQVGLSDASSPSSAVTPAGAPTFNAPTTGLSGIYDNSYSLQLTATGASTGSGNVAISTYTVTSGTLPAGLNLNSSTGLISGTPTATGSSAITVRATDANSQTADASFTIAITRSTQSIGFTISPTTAASTGSGYSASITPTLTNPGSGSGALTYAISGGTATGCSISSSSTIGTLTATSNGTCQITATKAQDDNYQQATASQSFTFLFASASTLVITSTSGVFGTDLTLTSSGGSTGGSTSYNTSTTGCSITAGVLQTTLATTCVVTATRTADAFTAQTTSEATNIVISGTPLTAPTITGVTAANTTQLTVTFTVSSNATSVSAYLYSASTGGSALQSLTSQSSGFSFTNLNPSTTYYVSLMAVGTGNYANSAESARTSGTTLAIAVVPSVNVSPSSASITLGQTVTFTATASSSDSGSLSYQWSFGGSPISGATTNQYIFTPGSVNQSGNYSVTVTNSQNGTTNTASASGSLSIAGALSITTPTTGLSGIYNSSYSLALSAAGGQTPLTYTVTSGTLPAGLNLNSSTGLISGTPTATGSSAITVRATDANSQTADASFTIAITRSTQSIGFTISPTTAASTGSGYSASITPTLTNPGSGSGALTYAISGGTATGCSISSSSTIGTLTATSNGTCQITATKAQDDNYQQATASQSFTFLFASASTLVITSTSGVFGTDLTLTSSGGSTGGSTSYNTSTTGCSITAGVLQTTLATTCVVTATRTADAFTAQTTSEATNIVISGTPLTAPTITGVTAANTTQLTVTFTVSSNATSVSAYLYSASTGGSALQSLTSQSSGFSFTNLNPSTTYYVSLMAVGTGNYANSAESARTSGTTLAGATPLLAALTPSFSVPIKTSDGFTVTVTNYDALFVTTARVNTASISNSIPSGSNWVLTVTGLSPGQSTTVTVETTRTGYVSGSASVASSAMTTSTQSSTVPTPVVTGPPPSSLKSLTTPKISRNEKSYFCEIGKFVFIREGRTEETPKLSSRVFSLLLNGKVIETLKSPLDKVSFAKSDSFMESTLTCQVEVGQENLSTTSYSLNSESIGAFALTKKKAMKDADAKYYKDRRDAYEKKDREFKRLATVKAAAIKTAKSSKEILSASSNYQKALATTSDIWKRGLADASSNRVLAKELAQKQYLDALEGAGISIYQVAIEAVVIPTPVPTSQPTPTPTPSPAATNVQPTAEMKKVETFYMASGSYFLNDATKISLKALALGFNASDIKQILVYGHTDSRGGVDNTWLSQQRAKAVANYLRPLLRDKKVLIGWYASSKPLANGSSKSDLAKNRRVEIYTK